MRTYVEILSEMGNLRQEEIRMIFRDLYIGNPFSARTILQAFDRAYHEIVAERAKLGITEGNLYDPPK